MKFHRDAYRIMRRPAKAGVLLIDAAYDGTRKFLVPYNEGRFAKSDPYFVLPKGSIEYQDECEPGKPFDSSPVAGGIRETAEETGVPLQKILGEENIRRLEKGETLYHIKHPDFPGFEILEASPKAYPHLYHARGGKEQTMVMYGFKVKGLEALKPYLKNPEGKTTKDFLDERPQMPRFPTFLQWMKQGFIPASGDLPEVALFKQPGWFNETIEKLAPQGIEMPDNWQGTRHNWQTFCASLDTQEFTPERKQFHKCFSLIKERLLQQGWIKGDLDALKFDEKDCPLFYYTEGGMVEDEKKIIHKTLSDMIANPDYARAFGGIGTRLVGLSPAETMVLGQVAAWGSFVKRTIWREALRDVMEVTGEIAQRFNKHRRNMRDWAATVTQVPEQASGQTGR